MFSNTFLKQALQWKPWGAEQLWSLLSPLPSALQSLSLGTLFESLSARPFIRQFSQSDFLLSLPHLFGQNAPPFFTLQLCTVRLSPPVLELAAFY